MTASWELWDDMALKVQPDPNPRMLVTQPFQGQCSCSVLYLIWD